MNLSFFLFSDQQKAKTSRTCFASGYLHCTWPRILQAGQRNCSTGQPLSKQFHISAAIFQKKNFIVVIYHAFYWLEKNLKIRSSNALKMQLYVSFILENLQWQQKKYRLLGNYWWWYKPPLPPSCYGSAGVLKSTCMIHLSQLVHQQWLTKSYQTN